MILKAVDLRPPTGGVHGAVEVAVFVPGSLRRIGTLPGAAVSPQQPAGIGVGIRESAGSGAGVYQGSKSCPRVRLLPGPRQNVRVNCRQQESAKVFAPQGIGATAGSLQPAV